MRVYGQLEFAQMHQSIPASIGTGKGGQFYADITTPAAILPKFYDGTAFRTIALQGLGLITNADIAANAAIATSKLSLTVPQFTFLIATGATAGYLVTVSSANCTVGDTYSDGTTTFTILATAVAKTAILMNGSVAPVANFTKLTGSGDATITFASQVAVAQYVPPAGAIYLDVELMGSGGGGQGSGTTNPAGGTGTLTFFGTDITTSVLLFQSNGGGGASGSGGGSGAQTGSVNSPAVGAFLTGASGQAGAKSGTTGVDLDGSCGASSAWGGGGGGNRGITGGSGRPNTGGGGAGGSVAGSVTGACGGGGGAGGLAFGVVAITANTKFYYILGAGGLAGTLGTGGNAGAAGALGGIKIWARFQ